MIVASSEELVSKGIEDVDSDTEDDVLVLIGVAEEELKVDGATEDAMYEIDADE